MAVMTDELKEYRTYSLGARELAEAVANQEPLLLTVGRSKVAKFYILPLDKYRPLIIETYGEDAEKDAKRVSTRTRRDELEEATLMAILMEQVDADWQPARFGVLTLDGADAAYLVPANEYWQGRVGS